jgi:TrmH family RNA methyltransferase
LPQSPELDNLVIVLVRTRNPLNIGAAARAMSNFGVHRLRLVNPYAVAFREARSAVGASELLKQAEEHKTLAEAVADCALVIGTTAGRKRTLQHPLRQLDDSSTELHEHLQTRRVALLFGSEKTGLTNDDFSHCHWLLTIPTQKDHVSMNLGQAVAVCLYELARQHKSQLSPPPSERAAAGANEQISQVLLEALDKSGYIQPGSEAVCEKKVRRMVLRFCLDPEEAKVFLGMVRQIVWRLRQVKPSSPRHRDTEGNESGRTE